MKAKFLLLSAAILLTSCGSTNETKSPEETNTLSATMKGDTFTVVNFADMHIENSEMLSETSLTMKTLKNCMETQKPDLVTFTGDTCWGNRLLTWYKNLCSTMDTYKVPYFFVLGNHERDVCTGKEIEYWVNQSEYGHIEKGEVDDDSYGNYVVDIKDQSNKVIHKLIMMDSRSYCTPKEEDYTYVNFPIDGVFYKTHMNRQIYGSENYDTIRDAQIEWYKKQVKTPKIESTLITHMPIREYAYAIEQYMNAIKFDGQSIIDELQPIGNCKMSEPVACSAKDYGFFQIMKNARSTKTMICGHDHINDYSLKYNGIRLTYAVKTGDGCYWDESGNTNGCTTLKIDATGAASISQYYFKAN